MALACAAACIPVAAGGGNGLVLCFGQGGHIAIELAHDDTHRSPDDHRDDQSGEHHPILTHDHCHSCLDIPLTVAKANQTFIDKKISRIRELSGYVAMTATRAAAVRPDLNSSGFAHRLSAPAPDLLEELRTTVLRT
jgi:hypothetical protein